MGGVMEDVLKKGSLRLERSTVFERFYLCVLAGACFANKDSHDALHDEKSDCMQSADIPKPRRSCVCQFPSIEMFVFSVLWIPLSQNVKLCKKLSTPPVQSRKQEKSIRRQFLCLKEKTKSCFRLTDTVVCLSHHKMSLLQTSLDCFGDFNTRNDFLTRIFRNLYGARHVSASDYVAQ